MPNLFIIAGPNGAGKSTSAPHVLSGPRRVHEFVNADVIEKEAGVSQIEAGRRTLARLEALANARQDMAFETTLSSRLLMPRIQVMQRQGYLFHLLFCWLPSADMAVARVAKRVAAGGHSIPEDVIRRRYERGLQHLFNDYLSIADTWRVVDNTAPPPGRMIAARDLGRAIRIERPSIWNTLVAEYMKPKAQEQARPTSQEELGWTSDDILAAVNRGATEALRRHKARGESVVIWRDGKIVELKPEEIEV